MVWRYWKLYALSCCSFAALSTELSNWAASWQNQQNDVRPVKAHLSLGIHPVWSVFAVRLKKAWVLSCPWSAQRRLWSRVPRLIWVFPRHTAILLVLIWGGSFESITVWKWKALSIELIAVRKFPAFMFPAKVGFEAWLVILTRFNRWSVLGAEPHVLLL